MPVEVDIKELAPCKKQFNIFVPPEEIQTAFEKSVKEVAATVALPGFRKGKVPKAIVEKRFGPQIESDVQGQLVTEEYHKALEEKEWKALGDPKIEDLSFDRKEGFRFSATVEVYPEIDIKDYKKIPLTRPEAVVEDKEIEDAITGLRRERATLENSEEASKEGDYITANAVYLVKDEEILKRDHAHIHVGHDHLADLNVKGLGEAVTGKKPGEEITLEVELDDNFPEEAHRGSKATVKVTIEEVKTEKLPELDEDFLKPLQVKDEAELKEKITESLKRQKDELNEENMCEEMLNKIAEGREIPIPEDLLKRQSLNLVQQSPAIYQIAQVPEEEREKFIEDEMKKMEEAATIQVRNFFILDTIANKEKIFVTEKEVAEHIYKMALSQGRSPEEVSNELREKGGLVEIRMGLRERKTLEWLLGKADITEGSGDAAEKKTKKKKKAKKENE